VDSAGKYGVTNNTRPYVVTEGRYDPVGFVTGNVAMPGYLFVTNLIRYAQYSTSSWNLYANNLVTGANTALVSVAYKIDATGKVIDVVNRSTLASLNPIFDASNPNRITVTANDQKQLDVKYSIRLTAPTPPSATTLNRPFTITEKYTYVKNNQVYY
jgi:hypothetical protein